jgi:hypothetical protein
MKSTMLAAALAVTLTFAQSAHAREHHSRYGVYHHTTRYAFAYRHAPRRYFDSAPAAFAWSGQSTYPGDHGGRPRAWCGWQMRQLVGGDPGPEFNLARSWARWGRAGPPGIGAVVVWPHHVGRIVGEENGKWIIQSGNDGDRTRTRVLPISGAIAIRWG